jgi:hypothetical protein
VKETLFFFGPTKGVRAEKKVVKKRFQIQSDEGNPVLSGRKRSSDNKNCGNPVCSRNL